MTDQSIYRKARHAPLVQWAVDPGQPLSYRKNGIIFGGELLISWLGGDRKKLANVPEQRMDVFIC